MAMLKWFTSLVLVAALSGSVSAGVPMHSSMNDWMMDCCKAALAHDDSAATSQARLCCALNCQEPVPTGATTLQPLSLFAPVPVAAIPHVLVQDLNQNLRRNQPVAQTGILQPAYLLNLALLI